MNKNVLALIILASAVLFLLPRSKSEHKSEHSGSKSKEKLMFLYKDWKKEHEDWIVVGIAPTLCESLIELLDFAGFKAKAIPVFVKLRPEKLTDKAKDLYERDFKPLGLDYYAFDHMLVMVEYDGKRIYFDPGILAYCKDCPDVFEEMPDYYLLKL